ncbi:hypothetical protein ACQY0O_004213 [Thecaphora frezii]
MSNVDPTSLSPPTVPASALAAATIPSTLAPPRPASDNLHIRSSTTAASVCKTVQEAMSAAVQKRPQNSLTMEPLHHAHSLAPRLGAAAAPLRSDREAMPPQGRLSTTQLFATLLQRNGSIAHAHAHAEDSLLSSPQGVKRKLAEELGAKFDITSPSDVVLPRDPARRASIINLATAAAAAVLQGQVAERRFSQQEHVNKRQRTREHQLALLAEQARMAHLAAARARNDSVGRADREKDAAPADAAPSTLAATQQPGKETAQSETRDAAVKLGALRSFSIPSDVPPASGPVVTAAFTVDAQHQQEWEATISSEGFLDEAKMVANHYGRFYRFEQEWANRALALGAYQTYPNHPERGPFVEQVVDSATRPASEDGAHKGQPPSAPSASIAEGSKAPLLPSHTGSCQVSPRGSPRGSPRIRSRASTRYPSRAVSPTAGAVERRSSGVAPGPGSGGSSPFAGPSQGLVSVISNFADLVKARQQSCSGLEALADQARELPGITSGISRTSSSSGAAALTSGDLNRDASLVQAGSIASADDSDELAGRSCETDSLGDTDLDARDVEDDKDAADDDDDAEGPQAPTADSRKERPTSPQPRPVEPMSIASMI